jgi:hypothetical protein
MALSLDSGDSGTWVRFALRKCHRDHENVSLCHVGLPEFPSHDRFRLPCLNDVPPLHDSNA